MSDDAEQGYLPQPAHAQYCENDLDPKLLSTTLDSTGSESYCKLQYWWYLLVRHFDIKLNTNLYKHDVRCSSIATVVRPLTRLIFERELLPHIRSAYADANQKEDVTDSSQVWISPKIDGIHAFVAVTRETRNRYMWCDDVSEFITKQVQSIFCNDYSSAPSPDEVEYLIEGEFLPFSVAGEGECAPHASGEEPRYYIFLPFDILVDNGISITHEMFCQRRKRLLEWCDRFEASNGPTNRSHHSSAGGSDSHVLKILLKPFYLLTDEEATHLAQEVISERSWKGKLKTTKQHTLQESLDVTCPSDGLVLVLDGMMYSQVHSYKWKPRDQITLDLVLVLQNEDASSGESATHRFHAYMSVTGKIYRLLNTPHTEKMVELVPTCGVHAPLVHPFFHHDAHEVELAREHFVEASVNVHQPFIAELKIQHLQKDGRKPTWSLVRCRNDKLRANCMRVCWENIWQYIYPIDILAFLELACQTRTSRAGLIQWNNSTYFKGTKSRATNFTAMLEAVGAIKRKLMSTYLRHRRVTIDLGVGRGQDLQKHMSSGVEKLLAVDSDPVALIECTQRYEAILSSLKNHTTTHLQLCCEDLTITENYNKWIQKILPWINDTCDAIVVNFAVHYWCSSSHSINCFAGLVSSLLGTTRLRMGGRLFMIVPCGKRIHELLKANQGIWENPPYRDEALYDCSDSRNIDKDGYPIPGKCQYRTRLPFTEQTLYIEPLLNTRELLRALMGQGFVIQRTGGLLEELPTLQNKAMQDRLTEADTLHMQKYIWVCLDKKGDRKRTPVPPIV